VSRSLREESPLEVAIKGAAAGLAGTLVLTLAMQNAPRFLPMGGQGGGAEQPSGTEGQTEPPTARLVEKVASGVFETELSPDARQTLGMGIHWLYGAFWGIAYGLVQSSLHLPAWLHGSLVGLGLWVFGPMGLARAMKLSSAPPERPASQRLISVLHHQIYGWTTAGTFRVLSRDA
jgi:hypothetical protein